MRILLQLTGVGTKSQLFFQKQQKKVNKTQNKVLMFLPQYKAIDKRVCKCFFWENHNYHKSPASSPEVQQRLGVYPLHILQNYFQTYTYILLQSIYWIISLQNPHHHQCATEAVVLLTQSAVKQGRRPLRDFPICSSTTKYLHKNIFLVSRIIDWSISNYLLSRCRWPLWDFPICSSTTKYLHKNMMII